MRIGRLPKREFDDLTFEKFEKIDFRDKLSRKDEKWRDLNGGARWRLCCLAYIHHLKASFHLLTVSHSAPLRGIHSIPSKIVPPKILKNLCSNYLWDKILFVHGDAEH
jgi:hypothetical protein